MIRSRYTFAVVQLVVIEETISMEGTSVTNDAEYVIQDLVDKGIDVDRHRIIYRDGEGHWDGLATTGGLFSGFIMLSKIRDRAEAIKAALSREPWAALHDLRR